MRVGACRWRFTILPFSWKYSPVICQRLVHGIVSSALCGHDATWHVYLDDAPVTVWSPELAERAIRAAVEALQDSRKAMDSDGFRARIVGAPSIYCFYWCLAWVPSLQHAELYAAHGAMKVAEGDHLRSNAVGIDNDASHIQTPEMWAAQDSMVHGHRKLRHIFSLRASSNLQVSTFWVSFASNPVDP